MEEKGVPIGQLTQNELDEALTVVENVPAGHFKQAFTLTDPVAAL